MLHLPPWVKLNKNWRPDIAYVKEGWITIDIFRETATRKQRVSSYREIKHPEPLIIEDLRTYLSTYFMNRKRYVIKGVSSQFITSVSRKYSLSPDEILRQYIDAGYLGIETSFQKDGLTISDIRYGLTARAILEVKRKTQILIEKNHSWIIEVENELNCLQILFNGKFTPEQQKLITFVESRLDKCKTEGKSLLWPNLSWRYSKDSKPGNYQRAIEFVISLLYCMSEAKVFDWKEIGSRLNPSIGASKQFDSIKNQLLYLLEEVTEKDPHELGLISLGSLYPLYISGPIDFDMVYGPLELSGDSIHCLSNIQLRQIQSVNILSSRIILTENRSILLKMYKTGWISDSSSLVMGIDGHLRSAHRHLINLIKKHSPSIPFFVWVDGDDAGQDIATNLVKLIPRPKIIGIQNNALFLFDCLEEWILNTEYKDTEQESVMGGPPEWDFLFFS